MATVRATDNNDKHEQTAETPSSIQQVRVSGARAGDTSVQRAATLSHTYVTFGIRHEMKL